MRNQHLFRIPLALLLIFGTGCAVHKDAAHIRTNTRPKETDSQDGAQHAFFPDRYEYSVGDFILSLPIGEYECAHYRLAFAKWILEAGSPKPVVEQTKYLRLPSDGLYPPQQFLVLDQRHLLIFSEFLDLEGGYPPTLRILERDGDAAWTNVTERHLPDWARSPKTVQFSRDLSSFTVISSDAKKKATWRWENGGLHKN